ATLHNEDEIKRLDLRIGDTVVIKKAGDVIPDIVKVLVEMRTGKEERYVFPEYLEACGGDGRLERISGQAAWRCVNRGSYAEQKRKLYYFVSKAGFDIDHLGPKIIDRLLDQGLIAAPYDIFTLKRGDLLTLPGFGEKSADNLLSSIESSKNIPLAKFITALSIDHVGEETANDLAEHFTTLERLRATSLDELQSIEGVGDVVAESVYTWFRDKKHAASLLKLIRLVKISPHKKEKARALFAGKTFVLTGTLEAFSRDEAKEKIRALGGDISSSVSGNTDYVVVGENPGSKYDEARKLGATTLSEEEFLTLMRA
ncbi:MAG: helix-hairpin-helix domain-containing protein, partial [bacterium]|nr:helix-hairpin-helix domain-containing protein [bacterium]